MKWILFRSWLELNSKLVMWIINILGRYCESITSTNSYSFLLYIVSRHKSEILKSVFNIFYTYNVLKQENIKSIIFSPRIISEICIIYQIKFKCTSRITIIISATASTVITRSAPRSAWWSSWSSTTSTHLSVVSSTKTTVESVIQIRTEKLHI